MITTKIVGGKYTSIIVGIFILIAIIVINFSFFKGEPQDTKQKQFVKQIISSYLKSPGSAEFVEIIVKKKLKTEDQYITFGEVDSQNSFGALLRSHFHIDLEYKGGDVTDIKNWVIDSLDLGDSNYIFEGKLRDEPLVLSESILAITRETENLYRGIK